MRGRDIGFVGCTDKCKNDTHYNNTRSVVDDGLHFIGGGVLIWDRPILLTP